MPSDVDSDALYEEDAPSGESGDLPAEDAPPPGVALRTTSELENMRNLLTTATALDPKVHEALLSRSWGLLDMARQLTVTRGITFWRGAHRCPRCVHRRLPEGHQR